MIDPDFVSQTCEPQTDDEKREWYRRSARDAESKGATFHQFAYHPDDNDLLLVESWTVRPEGDCPPPHFFIKATEARVTEPREAKTAPLS